MATVDGKTSAKIDQLLDATIIGGAVDQSSKHLILTTRGGTSIDAGSLASGRFENWYPTVTYQAGDRVGYAGSIWVALADNGNKPPALFSNSWLRVTGTSHDVWVEKDPYFESDTVNNSWSMAANNGGVISVSSIASERDSGLHSLKVSLPAGAEFACRPLDENIVRGGETIVVAVRVKLVAAVAGVTCESSLWQNDSTGGPYPAEPGVVGVTDGSRTITTAWQTFYFNTTAVNGKPRANFYISLRATGSNCIILVDFIHATRSNVVLQAWPIGSVFMSTSAANPATVLGGGTWVRWGQGRVVVSQDSTQTEFDGVEETGGEKTHLLTTPELPAHAHTVGFLTVDGGNHVHNLQFQWTNTTQTGGGAVRVTDIRNQTSGGGTAANASTDSDGGHTHTLSGTTGFPSITGGNAMNNMPPYITAYMWKRTA